MKTLAEKIANTKNKLDLIMETGEAVKPGEVVKQHHRSDQLIASLNNLERLRSELETKRNRPWYSFFTKWSEDRRNKKILKLRPPITPELDKILKTHGYTKIASSVLLPWLTDADKNDGPTGIEYKNNTHLVRIENWTYRIGRPDQDRIFLGKPLSGIFPWSWMHFFESGEVQQHDYAKTSEALAKSLKDYFENIEAFQRHMRK